MSKNDTHMYVKRTTPMEAICQSMLHEWLKIL
jgi:hypothetical protein